MTPILEARGLGKTYVGGDGRPIVVLRGLDLAVEQGEFIAIVGASGSGKSTLLHLLGALDRPTEGAILLEGEPLDQYSAATLAAIRNRRIGFVFQFHHLLRDFTALENAMMPLLIGAAAEADARSRGVDVLTSFGLADRLHHYPAQLSGGEQQRAAVARALISRPAVVLADEPSGNLDPTNAAHLHDELASLRDRFGAALVVATHNRELSGRADRVLRLSGGLLVAEGFGEEAIAG